MQLLKLAAASKRVLLVESNHILPLQQVLSPGGVQAGVRRDLLA
jgi:hypothetical protein